MYALVDIQGKQYKVENGSVLKVDRLEKEKGDNLLLTPGGFNLKVVISRIKTSG